MSVGVSLFGLVRNQAWFDVGLRLFGDLLVNLNDVLIHELLRQTTLLRTKLARAAPDHGITKLVQQALVDLHDARLDCEAVAILGQEERVVEVWQLTLLLGVDAHKLELLPNFVKQDVNSEVKVDGNAAILRVGSELINMLNGHGVNLVVGVDAFHVLAVALDGVNQD